MVYFEHGKIKVRIIDLDEAVDVDSLVIGVCGTDGYIHPEIYSLTDPQPYDIFHDIFYRNRYK